MNVSLPPKILNSIVVCRRAHVSLHYLCMFANSSVKHDSTIWVKRRVSYKREGTALLTRRAHMGSSPIFSGSVLCFWVFVFFLRPVSCVPNVVSNSELSIPFSLMFIYWNVCGIHTYITLSILANNLRQSKNKLNLLHMWVIR